ncbi:MAG: hypothetical protein RSF79_13425 [Janthinobacterium sp.]
MTTTEIIMAVLACINVALVLLAWRRTGKKDTQEDAATGEQMRSDMRYVMRGVDEIRVDVRAMRGDISNIDRRVTVVEEISKSAHKRLDEHIRMHPPDAAEQRGRAE